MKLYKREKYLKRIRGFYHDRMMIKEMKWIREPADYTISEDRITITTILKEWQKI